jgi:hypothetical protein
VSQSQYVRLALSDNRSLDSIFATAEAPPFETLVDFQWRGYNTDPNLRVLGLRKFIKAFFRGRNGDEGCNVKVEQNRLSEPWIPRTRNGGIDAFAFYLVGPQTPRTRLERNPNALLIDYAATPRNPAWHVERLIRDYVVQPFADNPDLVIGRAFLGIRRARFASSYFILERLAPLAADIPRDR